MKTPGKDSKPNLIFVTHAAGHRAGMIARGVIQTCYENNLSPIWQDYDQFDLSDLRGPPIGIAVWGKVKHVVGIIRRVGPKVPVVSTNANTFNLSVPTVAPDAGYIAEIVADHLVEQGIENFIYVGRTEYPSVTMGAEAFRLAVRKRLGRSTFRLFNVNVENRFWSSDSKLGGSFVRLLESIPTPMAIVAVNDHAAVNCIKCVQSLGLKIPQEVAVVGRDNHPLYERLIPALTTIRLDYGEIGRAAVERILLQSGGRPMLEWRRKFIKGELVIRASSQRALVNDQRLAKAVTHIQTHYSEAIALSDLCTVAGMSRANFVARFRNIVGETPIRYLINYRLEQAKTLLRQPSLTLREIMFQVGFDDQAYFSHSFKRITGSTPSEYRKAMLKSNTEQL